MEAGKEWGVGNHMLCIYAGVSQIMESSVSQQSLGRLSPPSSEAGLQDKPVPHTFTWSLTPFDLRGPLWRAWKETTEPTNVTPNTFAGFYLSSSPYSLWVKELGMALALSFPTAPLLPSTDQTFPSIQALRLKASTTFGPGNGFLERNISKRIKHFFLGFKMKIGAFLLLYGGKIPWKHFSVVYINIRACFPLPKPSNHFQTESVFSNSTFNNST